jgi:hypothetical protein
MKFSRIDPDYLFSSFPRFLVSIYALQPDTKKKVIKKRRPDLSRADHDDDPSLPWAYALPLPVPEEG